MLEKSIIPMPVLIKDLGMQFATATSKAKTRFGIYKCFCSNEFRTTTDDVNRKRTKSCGCLQGIHHDRSYHRLYSIWAGIIRRTTVKECKDYTNYGARGITVCERWLNIENFIEDMHPTYKEGLSIDRINNDGNYEPSNCRWADAITQAQNQRLIYVNNKSGYRGVDLFKNTGMWRARIQINKKSISLGAYKTALEGAKVYDAYVIKHNLEHPINGVL